MRDNAWVMLLLVVTTTGASTGPTKGSSDLAAECAKMIGRVTLLWKLATVPKVQIFSHTFSS